MKLDYKTMTSGQEFWAIDYNGAMCCKYITSKSDFHYTVEAEMNGKKVKLYRFSEIGIGVPFDNELEALQFRLKAIQENAVREAAIIQKRIAELGGK